MKKANLLVVALTVGASLIVAQPALAWHPEVAIVKKVQNVTAHGALADANTKEQSVATKPGDTLKYVIEISNPAKPADNKWNDLVKVVVTDNLPEGIELVGSPASRKITENITRLVPGQKITKEYLVKVTSKVDGAYIDNKVCVDGNSEADDAPRNDCDNAIVKVNVPVEPQKPVEPKTPDAPVVPETPTVIPSTGPEAFVLTGLGVSAAAYGAVRAARSTRAALRNK
jgi:uncharacterized repeat protein (TIGR01451 family)